MLVGREDVYDLLKEMGVENPKEYEVLNSRNSPLVGRAVDYIYEKHQRHGLLRREIERMVNQDRNYFAAAMLALGEADAMITGTTRPFSQSLRQVRTVIDDEPDATPFGINVIVSRSHTVLIADTAVTERPTAEQYAAIALRASSFARRMGLEPRVAFISYTTFGNPPGMHIEELREAVKLLDGFHADFEYEGEMAPDVALNYDMQRRYYPFSRLSGPANILVMPGPPVGEPFGQAAASGRRRKRARPLYPRARASGADRADDGERVGPGDARGARRAATPMRASSAKQAAKV